MKPFRVFIFLFITFLIITTLTSLFYIFYVIKDIIEFDMDVEVDNKIGFNLDSDAIHFGTVPAGNKITRYMSINHSRGKPIRIGLKAFGEMGKWLDYSDNGFVLEKNKKRIITLTLYVPEDASVSKYNGKLRVYIKRKFP